MTLKEKFKPFVFYVTESFNVAREKDKEKNAIECELIADEFAIEFAEWCDDNYFKNGKGNSIWSASLDWDDDEKFTTKELLEIFKKEKGL